MKKWIIGGVLLNLALFGWMRWGGALTKDVDAQLVQTSLNADKISLLELPAASAVVPNVVVAPSVKPDTTPSMSLSLSPVPSPVAKPVPIPLVPAPAPAPVERAPVEEKPEVAPVQALANCTEWGEFSGSDLVRAQQALSMLKLGDDLSQRTVEQNHGYWVYIPPQKKRKEVEKKIRQLKEIGVKDYFVVQEKGAWLNAISLGLFKTEDAAQKFLAALRAKGVRSAKVGERNSKLKFTVFVMKELDTGAEDKLKALQKEFPDSELKVSACGD